MPIPDSHKAKAEEMRAALVEKAAEQTEELMEKYLDTMELSIEDIKK